jgi:hypothetical protein
MKSLLNVIKSKLEFACNLSAKAKQTYSYIESNVFSKCTAINIYNITMHRWNVRMWSKCNLSIFIKTYQLQSREKKLYCLYFKVFSIGNGGFNRKPSCISFNKEFSKSTKSKHPDTTSTGM